MKEVPADKKKSLGKLPTEVRNKMGFMKKGGSVKGKCKVDGIAVRGRTKAKHK